MEILPLTKDLIADAGAIYACSWQTAYKGIIPQAYLDNLSASKWTAFLQSAQQNSYLLLDKGRCIATASISPARDELKPGWGEIISLYVLPAYWGQGYGSALFSYIVAQLKQQGFAHLYLWVLEKNLRARAFYEQKGFSPNGDQETALIGGAELVEIRYTNC